MGVVTTTGIGIGAKIRNVGVRVRVRVWSRKYDAASERVRHDQGKVQS